MKLLRTMGKCIGIGICVNPLTVCFYVHHLGMIMGLEPLGESGSIINKKTQKTLTNNKVHNIPFIKNLSESCGLIFMIFHPFGIPFSIYFATETTYNAINYLLFYKKRVEMGEFDK
jgi:hypothetical protein